MTIALILLILLVAYAYVGYGVLVRLVLAITGRNKSKADDSFTPQVALIIPCYNEADYILDKVENSFNLDYPKELLEIIFISDGSDDGTKEKLSTVEGIQHLHQDGRAGKAAAMNRAVAATEAEIVVFCDANTYLNPEALRLLVRHYADPKVGGVTGEKKILSQSDAGASVQGEGLYWKYESFLKQCDSDLYTVVGAAGELMSYRKSLYQELAPDTLLDDFMQSMGVVLQGYRVIYEKEAFAAETASANVKEELKRKIRICAGGWQSMSRLPKALNPFFNFRVSLAYISHRALRWSLAAFALPPIFILNALLVVQSASIWNMGLLIAQIVFYAMAYLGWRAEQKGKSSRVLYIPYYFSIMNLAVFLGFTRFLKGSQSALWERAKRA